MSWPVYCDECSKELTDVELLNGRADSPLGEDYCAECASEQLPER